MKIRTKEKSYEEVISLPKKKETIKEYFQVNQIDKKYYKYAITAVWMVVFIVAEGLLMFSGIQRL